MSLINQSFDKAASKLEGGPIVGDLLRRVRDALLREFGSDLWRLFHEHGDESLGRVKVERRIFGIPINFDLELKVKHAKKLIELIVGPEPVSA